MRMNLVFCEWSSPHPKKSPKERRLVVCVNITYSLVFLAFRIRIWYFLLNLKWRIAYNSNLSSSQDFVVQRLRNEETNTFAEWQLCPRLWTCSFPYVTWFDPNHTSWYKHYLTHFTDYWLRTRHLPSTVVGNSRAPKTCHPDHHDFVL